MRRYALLFIIILSIASVYAQQINLVEYVDTGFVLQEGKYLKATDFIVPTPPTFTGYEPGSTVGVKLPTGEIVIVEGYGERGFWIFQVYSGFKVYKVFNGTEKVLANINQGVEAGTYTVYLKYQGGYIYFSYTKQWYQGDIEPQVIYSMYIGSGYTLNVVGKNVELEDPGGGQGNPSNPNDNTYVPQIVAYEYMPYILAGLFLLILVVVVLKR